MLVAERLMKLAVSVFVSLERVGEPSLSSRFCLRTTLYFRSSTLSGIFFPLLVLAAERLMGAEFSCESSEGVRELGGRVGRKISTLYCFFLWVEDDLSQHA